MRLKTTNGSGEDITYALHWTVGDYIRVGVLAGSVMIGTIAAFFTFARHASDSQIHQTIDQKYTSWERWHNPIENQLQEDIQHNAEQIKVLTDLIGVTHAKQIATDATLESHIEREHE
jgi:hypothetical protein